MKNENLLVVGKKKGEWDFSVRSTIRDLSFEEMQEFRAMTIVAIGIAEEEWRQANLARTSTMMGVTQ